MGGGGSGNDGPGPRCCGESGLAGDCSAFAPGGESVGAGCSEVAEVTCCCGDGEERKDVSSSADESVVVSPTRAGGSLSGTASADVI